MLFPESWLRTFVNPDIGTEELAHRLTMAGLEIEGTEPAAPAFTGVVVAQIMEAVQHPNADKLRVCKVDAGTGELLQIVCGAPNARPGIKIPLATVGAVLPGNFKISKGKLRGEESFGMLCSSKELGIADENAGLLELPETAPIGQNIRDYLNLDDTVFEIKLTPNRADCLSILGVAREVSALTSNPLTIPSFEPVAVSINDTLAVTVQAPDLCGRFAGRVIRGVNAKVPTPAWIKQRIERAGQRSISALVDISNYVMLELGRPTHVFDLAKVNGGLTVRWAKKGEQAKLLNGQTIDLDTDVGVITSGDNIESLAGIMGGDDSAVTLDTTDIYIEAAFWHADAIAGRARRFKFSTEASHRFERGVDFASIADHLEYITRLILDVCGGQAGPVDDQVINLPKRAEVRMRLTRCQKILGIAVSAQQVAEIFTQLGLAFRQEGDDFIVQAPSYRFDIEIEEDLIEEVARIYGFDNIPTNPPVAPAEMKSQPETVGNLHHLRHLMAAQDYQEVVNFSFVEQAWEEQFMDNHEPVRLLNPIASQLAVMRSGLIAGLVDNIVYNANRKQTRVRVFECGRIFKRDSAIVDGALTVNGVYQPIHLAGAAWGGASVEQWAEKTRYVDFYDVKNDVLNLFGDQQHRLRFEAKAFVALHPGRSAAILLDNQEIGFIGELHPKLAQERELNNAPVVFEFATDAWMQKSLPQVNTISKQPIVLRDLAIWVDANLEVQSILDTLANGAKTNKDLNIIQNVQLFDVWKNTQTQTTEKSLAFRFSLQDPEVTLEDARVELCMKAVLDLLVQTHSVRQR